MGKSFPCQSCKKWPMQVPVYQCHEGHAFCSPCSDKKKCPTCGNQMPRKKIRCLAVEGLQPIECDQGGCDKKFETQQEMKDHVVNDCKFRKISLCHTLGMKECPFRVSPKNLEEIASHLEMVHKIRYYDETWDSETRYIMMVAPQDKVALVFEWFAKYGHRFCRAHPFGASDEIKKVVIDVETFYLTSAIGRTFQGDLTVATPVSAVHRYQLKPVIDSIQVKPWDLGPIMGMDDKVHVKYVGAAYALRLYLPERSN